MLTIILYGRNDGHGYNYHKRIAISINCLAEVLSDSDDEIIFVDYNTPDDQPTILEAVYDTLTAKAKQFLKIFRARPLHHPKTKTRLPVLEPLARNIAIQRSNALNRWILSTNIDMIFVPIAGQTLSEICASLPDGFYSLPRFEIPENLWESHFNRLTPSHTLEFLRENSLRLHLDTIVKKENFILYDNPGDFQLVLRKDLFKIGGFDESMVQGWHVDSNLFKRLSLIQNPGKPLTDQLKGYHCNHTLQDSVGHRPYRTTNSWGLFVDNAAISIKANNEDWGAANTTIEEVFLGSNNHLTSTLEQLSTFVPKTEAITFSPRRFNHPTYSTPRIFTFLIDHLKNLPKSTSILYVGYNDTLVDMIQAYLQKNHFSGRLFRSIESHCGVAIFDFGFDDGLTIPSDEKSKKLKSVMKSFLSLVKSRSKTKVIGININYSHFYPLFSKHLSMRLNSYITGIAYGYFPKQPKLFSIPRLFLKKRAMMRLRYLLIRYFYRLSAPLHALAAKFKGS